MMEKAGIQLKTAESKLTEKITLCVTPELKELWIYCNENAIGLPEAIRAHMRGLLASVRSEIERDLIDRRF